LKYKSLINNQYTFVTILCRRHRLFLTHQSAGVLLGALFIIWALCVTVPFAFAANDSPADSLTFDHLDTGFPLEGKHANLECERCHHGGTFVNLPTQCNQCHDGVFALGKSPTHIPTHASCDTCHTPEGFSMTAQVLFDHSAVAVQACVNCHNGSITVGESPDHLRTTNRCEACHNYSAWLPVIQPFNHAETLGSCASFGCHDGSGSGRGKPVGHPLTSNLCESCHSYPQWTVMNTPFNHTGVLEPGCNRVGCHSASEKPADHPAVTTDRCEQCHTSMGSWIVDPGFDHNLTAQLNCVSSHCHSESDKGGGHPLVSAVDCQACHASKGQWLPLALPFDHALTTDSCARCHNGTTAPDKDSLHPGTTAQCEVCHIAGQGWANLVLPLDHAQVTQANCSSVKCHSDADQYKSSGNHPNTSNACETCHQNTTDWLDVTLQSHTFVDSCGTSACHGAGGSATAKSANHPNTTDQCQGCHAYPSWKPLLSIIDHAQANDLCFNCHNGTIARGKGSGHPQTSNQCDSCHNTSDWLQVADLHSDPLNAMNCARAGCHDGNATAKPAQHPATSSVCEACHAYNVWNTLNQPFAHEQTNDKCEVCHNGTIATGKNPATHVSTTLPCDSCHDVNNWPIAVLDHSVVAGLKCATSGCHDGVAGGPTFKSPTHPLTSDLCEACHNTSRWIPTITPIDHTQTTAQCTTCHNGTIATGKPADHCRTSLECDQCHTTSSWIAIAGSAMCGGGGG
jgi:hypothetical protein